VDIISGRRHKKDPITLNIFFCALLLERVAEGEKR
jgi:hypothetical protein